VIERLDKGGPPPRTSTKRPRASGHAPGHSKANPATVKPSAFEESFRRLWRGEQPLWKAFWLYLFLGSLVAAALALLVVFLMGSTFGDAGYRLAMFLALPALVFYNLFAGIGAWRSASWSSVTGILARIYIFFALPLFLVNIGLILIAVLQG
jgi:hypothetical protein